MVGRVGADVGRDGGGGGRREVDGAKQSAALDDVSNEPRTPKYRG